MSGGARELRWRIKGWLAWFVALNVLWLVFISAWVVEEEILGLFAAAIGATAAEAVREQGLTGFRMRARWLLKARVAARGGPCARRVLVLQSAGRPGDGPGAGPGPLPRRGGHRCPTTATSRPPSGRC